MVAIAHQEVRKVFPSATSTGARRFVGKTAIVVGASANVGRALAGLLAQEGADVVVHYNSASKKDVNDKAAFFLLKEASKKIADEGRVLSFVTTMVAAFAPTYAGYAGSKAPLEHFSKSLAKELGGRGITVNCIAPGPLDTSFFYPAESNENIGWLKSMSIDGGVGNIADITGLALFLVSPEARWMTGTTSYINGGIVSPIN